MPWRVPDSRRRGRALLAASILLLPLALPAAAAAGPIRRVPPAEPEAPLPVPPIPPADVPEFAAAPVPDYDVRAPVTRQSEDPHFSPSLYMPRGTIASDSAIQGAVPGSPGQVEQNHRQLLPTPGLNLNIPLH